MSSLEGPLNVRFARRWQPRCAQRPAMDDHGLGYTKQESALGALTCWRSVFVCWTIPINSRSDEQLKPSWVIHNEPPLLGSPRRA